MTAMSGEEDLFWSGKLVLFMKKKNKGVMGKEADSTSPICTMQKVTLFMFLLGGCKPG